jgi:hypothetical protein
LSPDRTRHLAGVSRAFLAGAALGVVAFTAGSVVLYEAAGLLPATAGLTATLLSALAAGLWAGAPGARTARSPAGRWLLGSASLVVAGVFSVARQVFFADGPAATRGLSLLVLAGVPAYAMGLVLTALVAWEQRLDDAAAEDAEDDDEEEGDAGEGGPAFGAAARVAFGTLLGAAAGAAAAGLLLLPTLTPAALLLLTAAVVSVPFYFTAPPRKEGTQEEELYRAESALGTVRVTEVVFPGRRQPERRLYQDDETESGELVRTGAPTFAYIAAAERLLGEVSARGERYLFLGGGAYTLPRRVAERDPSARITVVELDPDVTAVAYRFFGLRPEHGVASIHGDARAVLPTLPQGAWDRVFVDVYDGTESVPYPLVTREAFEALRAAVAPDGLVVCNVIGVVTGDGHRRLWSTVRTAAEVFPGAALFSHLGADYPDRQNFLLVLSPVSEAALPAAAGGFEPWPRAHWPLGDAVVFRDRYPSPAPAAGATGPGSPAPGAASAAAQA